MLPKSAHRPLVHSLTSSCPRGLVGLLLLLSALRSPHLFTADGMAGGILVASPLILAAMAITPDRHGRPGRRRSLHRTSCRLHQCVTIVAWLTPHGWGQPIVVFVYAAAVACAWQAILALVIVNVRVSPIIVMLAGYMILAGANLVVLPRPSGSAPGWLADWGRWNRPLFAGARGPGHGWSHVVLHSEVGTLRQHPATWCRRENGLIPAGSMSTSSGSPRIWPADCSQRWPAICLTGVIGSGDPKPRQSADASGRSPPLCWVEPPFLAGEAAPSEARAGRHRHVPYFQRPLDGKLRLDDRLHNAGRRMV